MDIETQMNMLYKRKHNPSLHHQSNPFMLLQVAFMKSG